MNGHGESDRVVVPEKPPNKEEKAGEVPANESAEEVEERTLAKENSRQQNTHRTQRRERVRSALARVRRAAEEDRGRRFTTLLHHVYAVDTLREAYLSLKRGAAPGSGPCDVGGVRRGAGGSPPGSLRAPATRSLPGTTGEEGEYPEAGRPAATVGHHRAGGQGRPDGGDDGAE